MSNDNNKGNSKPSTPPAIAPLSTDVGKDWVPASESFDIRKSVPHNEPQTRNDTTVSFSPPPPAPPRPPK